MGLPVRAVETVSAPFRAVWNAAMVDGVASFWVRQGDTGRPLAVLLKNADGSDAAMPPGTTCTFKMVHQQTGHVVSGAAALSDGPNTASNNMATYPLSAPADTAQPGVYDAAWSVAYPGGGSETFPTRPSRGQAGYTVEVVAALGDSGLSG